MNVRGLRLTTRGFMYELGLAYPQTLAVECLKWREIAKNEKNIYVLSGPYTL